MTTEMDSLHTKNASTFPQTLFALTSFVNTMIHKPLDIQDDLKPKNSLHGVTGGHTCRKISANISKDALLANALKPTTTNLTTHSILMMFQNNPGNTSPLTSSPAYLNPMDIMQY